MDTEKKTGNKAVRRMRWALLNVLLIGTAWAGVQGNAGAGRVAVFLVWVLTVGWIFMGLDAKRMAEMDAQPRSVPAWLNHATRLVLVGLFVWHGWWVTAVACVWCLASDFGCAERSRKAVEGKNTNHG